MHLNHLNFPYSHSTQSPSLNITHQKNLYLSNIKITFSHISFHHLFFIIIMFCTFSTNIKDVFRQMIEYVHTGNVTLQPRTLLGVMNAADYYGLEELKRACNGFVQQGCITVDTVCALLSSAEKYIQYKCTKSLVQKVLEFVDEHGKDTSAVWDAKALNIYL